MLSRRHLLGMAALAARAQSPPVRWIVPNSPGGGYDAYSRLLKPFLEQELGASIRIDNVPGAGGLRGAAVLSNASPDGLTMGILNMPGLLMASMTDEETPAPFARFTILGVIADNSYLWATRPSSKIRSVDDLAAIGAGRGLVFGVNSPHNIGYLASALALQMLGWKARFVPGYGGSAEKVLAAARGEVDLVPLSWDSLAPHTLTGELRPVLSIAADTTRLFPLFKNVPALNESDGLIAQRAPESIDDIEATVRFMQAGRVLAAPPGLDPSLADHLRNAICRALWRPELADEASKKGSDVQPRCAKDAVRRLRSVRADAHRLAQLAPNALRLVQQ